MVVKDVEIDSEGNKHYVFGEDVLFQMCAEAILTADGAIDNGFPDLALKQIQAMAAKLREDGNG
jgi:hypothetical protein